MDIKSELLRKLTYKFVNKTNLDLDIHDLDVKMEDNNVKISFNGDVTISRDELIKLLFKA